MSANKNHYILLDAARGLAALAVFLYHLKTFIYPDTSFGESHFLVKSYLAVDLFFLMSGVVIARSYETKLLSHALSFKEFFWVRLIRLYPLYVSGILLGLGYILFRWLIKHEDPIDPLELSRSFSLNALFLPDFYNPKGIFVLDPAAWSLSLEWIINIIYAAFAVRFSTKVLGYLTACGAILLIGTAFYTNGLDIGWSADNFSGGFVRILFSFTLGVWMYRVMEKSPQIRIIHPVMLLIPVMAVIIIPMKEYAVYYDLFSALIIFPVFVYYACSARVVDALQRPFFIFGQMSYALYVLHTPLIMWIAGAWKMVTRSDPQDQAVISFSCIAIGVLAISYVATVMFDEPVRKFLRTKFIKPKP